MHTIDDMNVTQNNVIIDTHYEYLYKYEIKEENILQPETILLQLQLRMQYSISFFQSQVIFSPAFSIGKRVGGKTTDEIESLESLALSSQMQDICLSLESFRTFVQQFYLRKILYYHLFKYILNHLFLCINLYIFILSLLKF